MRFSVRVVVVIGILALAPLTISADVLYSLQTGAYPTRALAEAHAGTVSSIASPVFIHEIQDGSGYPFKVRVGVFSEYAQAWSYKTRVQPDSGLSGFLVQWDGDSALLANIKFPVQLPFDTEGASAVDPPSATLCWKSAGFDQYGNVGNELLQTSPGSMTREQLLEVAVNAPWFPTEGIVCANQFLSTYPGDSEANRVRLCLARTLGRSADRARAAELIAQVQSTGSDAEKIMAEFLSAHLVYNGKDLASSYEKFRSLAGNSTAPPSLRRECMSMAANIAHARQDYATAWLAFEQLGNTTPDASIASEALMQRAGLAFELVTRGKSNWNEVRRSCEEVIEAPNALHNTRATAALMHLETFIEQENYSQGLVEAEAFLGQYSDVAREYAMAVMWRGTCLVKLNRNSEARQVFEELMKQSLPAQHKFGGVEPKANAALWLAWIASLEGNTNSRDQWLQVLNLEYPNSQETQKAHQLFLQ